MGHLSAKLGLGVYYTFQSQMMSTFLNCILLTEAMLI